MSDWRGLILCILPGISVNTKMHISILVVDCKWRPQRKMTIRDHELYQTMKWKNVFVCNSTADTRFLIHNVIFFKWKSVSNSGLNTFNKLLVERVLLLKDNTCLQLWTLEFYLFHSICGLVNEIRNCKYLFRLFSTMVRTVVKGNFCGYTDVIYRNDHTHVQSLTGTRGTICVYT